jgi:hypothetical protein
MGLEHGRVEPCGDLFGVLGDDAGCGLDDGLGLRGEQGLTVLFDHGGHG